MVTKEEAELLKKRALNFLENANDLLKKEIFDIAAFNVEQFCQLFLKYKLLMELGDFPKTHSIRDLLAELGKVKKKEKLENLLWKMRL